MPLPKPPTKRADMLNADDFTSQPKPVKTAKSTTTRSASAKAASAASQPPVLELVKPTATSSAATSPATPATSPASTRTKSGRVAAVVAEPAAQPIVAAKPHTGSATTTRASGSPDTRARATTGSTTTRRRRDMSGPAKLFVLDTNLLLHDPMSLFRFEEHDVYLPMITLEELDGHKKGMTEVARNARQVSRDLDQLAADMNGSQMDPNAGIPLAKTGHVEAGGKLYFQTSGMDIQLPAGLPQGKADNQILGVVQALRSQHPARDVVLVSKDINMRIKARALGLPA